MAPNSMFLHAIIRGVDEMSDLGLLVQVENLTSRVNIYKVLMWLSQVALLSILRTMQIE